MVIVSLLSNFHRWQLEGYMVIVSFLSNFDRWQLEGYMVMVSLLSNFDRWQLEGYSVMVSLLSNFDRWQLECYMVIFSLFSNFHRWQLEGYMVIVSLLSHFDRWQLEVGCPNFAYKKVSLQSETQTVSLGFAPFSRNSGKIFLFHSALFCFKSFPSFRYKICFASKFRIGNSFASNFLHNFAKESHFFIMFLNYVFNPPKSKNFHGLQGP